MIKDDPSPWLWIDLLSRTTHWHAAKRITVFLVTLITLIGLYLFSPYSSVDSSAFVVKKVGVHTAFADLSRDAFRDELQCGKRDEVADVKIWNAAVEKYKDLRDDKFTYVLAFAVIDVAF